MKRVRTAAERSTKNPSNASKSRRYEYKIDPKWLQAEWVEKREVQQAGEEGQPAGVVTIPIMVHMFIVSATQLAL
jgi:hypothetical protein